MRRPLISLAVLIVACAVCFAVPAGSAAKPKCKHRHPHHRKRCHRKSSGGSSTGTGQGGSTGTSGTTGSGTPGRLLATEREISPSELQLQLSRPSLAAGTAIVEQYNAGSDPHNLILEKGGKVSFAYPTLDPGGDQKQTVVLRRGTYTLYCNLLNHRALGMQATLTVN
jgi:plastocyanin